MNEALLLQTLKEISEKQKVMAKKIARIEAAVAKSQIPPLTTEDQKIMASNIAKMKKDIEQYKADHKGLTGVSDEQKVMNAKVATMERDLEISVNGYSPHQVVALLHYVDQIKEKETRRHENIRNAVINWTIPILLSAIVIGLIEKYK